MPACSLIVAFYNRIDYLKLVLAGVERQSFKNFEVIIADDGSSQKVTQEIETISRNISSPLIHIWHEDKGFRKNKILNSAIRASSSDYLIFIDGDCVPHKNFIEEHLQNSSQNVCLTGRRVNLSKSITNKLTVESIESGFLERNIHILLFDGLFGKSNYVEKGFYFKNKFLRHFVNKKTRGLLGCNFSLHKKNLEAINGFDERYDEPSIGEDSDVQFRLELLGINIKSLNNIAVQYHLFHKLQPRSEKNAALFREVQKAKTFFTPFGLQKKQLV